jgi:hypothetical protein
MENNLLNFLEKILRRVKDSNEPQIKELAPREEEDFLCSRCGINHEARDFMRAMLLLLLDQFEMDIKYLEFMRKKNFLTSEAFDHAISKTEKSKVSKKRERSLVLEGAHLVTFRILSIQSPQMSNTNYPDKDLDTINYFNFSNVKDKAKKQIKFLAINKSRHFFYGSLDYELLKDEMTNDTIISCTTYDLYLRDDVFNIKLTENDSYVRVESDDPDIPKASELITKIADTTRGLPNKIYVVQGEILATPERKINDKGHSIFRTVIGDDTGEIYVEENNSAYMQDIKRGDHVRVIGVRRKEVHLSLSEYGSIVRI